MVLTRVRNMFRRPSARTPVARPRPALGVTCLEDRRVPAAFVSTGLYVTPNYVSNGDIMIYGTEAPDTVVVSLESSGITVKQNNVNTFYPANQVWGGDIYFVGYGGNDWFQTNTSSNIRVTAYGMGGNDTLIGSSGNDTLSGGYGQDYLYGYYGDDALYAGDGWSESDDSVNYLYGGYGSDTLRGGSYYDELYGESGYDELYGNGGNDWLDGGTYTDYLEGGAGTDSLFGGEGDDDLNGGDDGCRDYLNGGTGNDWFQIDYSGAVNLDGPSDFKAGDRMYNN